MRERDWITSLFPFIFPAVLRSFDRSLRSLGQYSEIEWAGTTNKGVGERGRWEGTVKQDRSDCLWRRLDSDGKNRSVVGKLKERVPGQGTKSGIVSFDLFIGKKT